MAKKIKSTLEAMGVIMREVETMADGRRGNQSDSCVECGKLATHYSAYFCKECAKDFYVKGDEEDDGRREE